MVRFLFVTFAALATSICGCSSDSSDGGGTTCAKACASSTDCPEITCTEDGSTFTLQACMNKCCVDKCQ